MKDLLRDTFLGKTLRLVSGKRLLRYPEESSSFIIPEVYKVNADSVPDTPADNKALNYARESKDEEIGLKGAEAFEMQNRADEKAGEYTIVDWYGPNDPENPRNWSFGKKAFVTGVLCLLTCAVYGGSSIITAGWPSLVQQFLLADENPVQMVTLTLSLYVLAYGFGAMLFSPLSEIPSLGRNGFYVWPMLAYLLLQVGAPLTGSFSLLLVIRFFTGLMGSSCLATGGATLHDMVSTTYLPIMYSWWVLSAYLGPSIFPVFAGFAAQYKGWQWTMWELLWIIGFTWIVIFCLLPETSSDHILLKRAQRLRKVTGNLRLRSASELKQKQMTPSHLFVHTIFRPVKIGLLDPAICFTNIYTSLIYSIYYLFFASFPIVFGEHYNFTLSQEGIAFVAIAIGGVLGCIIYVSYQYMHVVPYTIKNGCTHEKRLESALIASFVLTASLFMYGWTAERTSWFVPLIAVCMTAFANFFLFQCALIYVTVVYPQYAASLLAANDFSRSALAAGMLHVAEPMYRKLGIDGGSSLLAGLTFVCIPLLWLTWRYGAALRAKSRFRDIM